MKREIFSFFFEGIKPNIFVNEPEETSDKYLFFPIVISICVCCSINHEWGKSYIPYFEFGKDVYTSFLSSSPPFLFWSHLEKEMIKKGQLTWINL